MKSKSAKISTILSRKRSNIDRRENENDHRKYLLVKQATIIIIMIIFSQLLLSYLLCVVLYHAWESAHKYLKIHLWHAVIAS